MSARVGLFLGAGASFELGMPLVWQLTAEFKGFYTPERFRHICEESRFGEVPISDEVRDNTLAVLARPDLHYENVLGYLQTAHRRMGIDQHIGRQYHVLYVSMVSIIYALLYHRQVKSTGYILRSLLPFEGLAGVLPDAEPLWIFSLNHDVMIELLADRLNLPLKDGFFESNRLHIPNPDRAGFLRPGLVAHVLPEKALADGHLDFFHSGRGINLFKIHGALNTFMCRDGKDICRLAPTRTGADGILDAMVVANEQLGHWINGNRVRTNGEIVYTDVNGEMQFLRRTLLAGAQKFTTRFDQNLPRRMLEMFKSYINHVGHLYVIGYSFGDSHVDQILREWLESGFDRKLTIVDPIRRDVPAYFRHLAPDVELECATASDFFLKYRRKPLTWQQKVERRMLQRFRPWIERQAANKR